MKNLNTFLPYVLPHAKGVPHLVARAAVMDAAIEFCERGGVLQSTLDPMSTNAGQREHDLELPTKFDLVQIKRAWFKGNEMVPAALEDLYAVSALNDETPGVEPVTGDPRAYWQVSPTVVGLYPRPKLSEQGVITMRVSLKPARSSTQLDDVLFNEWVEVIAAGALMRLLNTPGEPYTDVAKAADHARAFAAGVDKAKYLANYGRTRAELSVIMRPIV